MLFNLKSKTYEFQETIIKRIIEEENPVRL